jgi:hypothetical protein
VRGHWLLVLTGQTSLRLPPTPLSRGCAVYGRHGVGASTYLSSLPFRSTGSLPCRSTAAVLLLAHAGESGGSAGGPQWDSKYSWALAAALD